MTERIVGGIMGFAIGNAMGMPLTDRMNWRRRYVEAVYTDTYLDPLYGSETPWLRKGMYTSHTQMMLTALESFVGIKAYEPEDIGKRLVDLRRIQKGESKFRAPGWATVYGIDKMRKNIFKQEAENKRWRFSQCGWEKGFDSDALSRSFLLYMFSGNEYLQEELKELVYMTHRNEDVLVCSIVFNKLLEYLSKHPIPDRQDGRNMLDFLLNDESVQESSVLVGRIKQIYMQIHIKEEIDIASMGIRNPCHEVLASALYSFLHEPVNYRKAVANAISLGGEADARAALTGLLAGFNLGSANLDRDLIDGLENFEEIAELADKFAKLSAL